MVCPSPELARTTAAVLVAVALGLTLSETAAANDATAAARPTRFAPALQSVAMSGGLACSAVCVAQQSVASALQEPFRIGSTQLKLGVASSKLTVGWAIAF